MKRSILFPDGSIMTYTGMHADIEAQSFVDHWNASHGRSRCSIVLTQKEKDFVSGATTRMSDEETRSESRESGLFFEKSKSAVGIYNIPTDSHG